ncbi:MAG: hypothetical protein WDO73_31565 [Ignavibacteriota bacterium]
MLFGLLPALRSTRPDLTPSLKPGVTGNGKRRRLFGRSSLVVGQVAGSLLMLILASQCFRGAAIVLAEPTGFRTEHLLTATFDPSLARYTAPKPTNSNRQLLDKTRALPAVRAAALTEAVPMLPGGSTIRVLPEGYQLPAGATAASVSADSVSEDYFTALDIPSLPDARSLSQIAPTRPWWPSSTSSSPTSIFQPERGGQALPRGRRRRQSTGRANRRHRPAEQVLLRHRTAGGLRVLTDRTATANLDGPLLPA